MLGAIRDTSLHAAASSPVLLSNLPWRASEDCQAKGTQCQCKWAPFISRHWHMAGHCPRPPRQNWCNLLACRVTAQTIYPTVPSEENRSQERAAKTSQLYHNNTHAHNTLEKKRMLSLTPPPKPMGEQKLLFSFLPLSSEVNVYDLVNTQVAGIVLHQKGKLAVPYQCSL